MAVLSRHAQDDKIQPTQPVKTTADDEAQDMDAMARASAPTDDRLSMETKRVSSTTARSSEENVRTEEERGLPRTVHGPATTTLTRAKTVVVVHSEATDTPTRTSSPRKRAQSWPPRTAAFERASEHESVHFHTASAAQDVPEACRMRTPVKKQVGSVWRNMTLVVDRNGVTCERTSLVCHKTKAWRIAKDDLLAATRRDETSVDVHYMLPGTGPEHRRLLRRYRRVRLRCPDERRAAQLVACVQFYVKWMARVPDTAVRRIQVVVNPHAGRRRGRKVWDRWRPVLELADIQCDVEETAYSGHARDLGAAFDLARKYEAIVFVGGDGTVNEFMNGVFGRDERVWRTLVATTPIALVCAGTDNAFGQGVGTPTPASAVYCIITRQIRPLDVLSCQASNEDGTHRHEFACTGVSYGIGADIAVESEATRWMGVHRYVYLKLKRGVFAPRKHHARIRYVLSDTTPVDPVTGEQVLRTYYELQQDPARDEQQDVDHCSIYDTRVRTWEGDASSIFAPARDASFQGLWRTLTAELTSAGGSNVYFETKYAHPWDGNFDFIYSRKGSVRQTTKLVVQYLRDTFLASELVGYYKVKALVIEPLGDNDDRRLNVDGEVFAGPGPFRIEVVPHLLRVLSEK
ncbi:hypothetical protein PsorP6_005632 [Peronosclerospora sorghi]|uniref:Uncharacterized protein n=1 Tax=Peronosclerospora sorghi TaxID=230839 RepID=A0ACC0W4Y7_9STRA|nr:hypothetical protein PsorP6_005632 [Peronosclerospora sorghi]